MFAYRIKSNIEYNGLDFPCGNLREVEIKTEKEINIHDKESKIIIFEAMKSAKLIAEWVKVEQLWLSNKTALQEGKIHFTSEHSYWQNGVIAFWERIPE